MGINPEDTNGVGTLSRGQSVRKLNAGSSGGSGAPKNSRRCSNGNNPVRTASGNMREIIQPSIG